MTNEIKICIDEDLSSRLDYLADATRKSKSSLVAEALGNFLEVNDWQMNEIETAITEADRSEFASEEIISNVFNKWM